MSNHRIRRIVFLSMVICFWMTVSACSCGNSLSRLVRPAQAVPTLGPTPRIEGQATKPTTAQPTQAAATRAPLLSPTLANGAAPPSLEELLPNDLDRAIDIAVTEEQINTYLAEQTFSAEGAKIEDIQATITAENIVVTLNAQYEPLNLNAGVTMQGIPVVVDSQAFIQIQNIELDSSVPAFTRMLAQVAIEQALAQYATESGIPIPMESIEVKGVSLEPGKIIITGLSRAN